MGIKISLKDATAIFKIFKNSVNNRLNHKFVGFYFHH